MRGKQAPAFSQYHQDHQFFEEINWLVWQTTPTLGPLIHRCGVCLDSSHRLFVCRWRCLSCFSFGLLGLNSFWYIFRDVKCALRLSYFPIQCNLALVSVFRLNEIFTRLFNYFRTRRYQIGKPIYSEFPKCGHFLQRQIECLQQVVIKHAFLKFS